MVEFDLFPKQGESLAGLSLWFQKTLIGLGGCGVLKDLDITRVSASEVTVASGYYSYYGVATTHVGATLSAVPVASSGMHRYDVIILNALTGIIERLAGTEAVPDNSSNFLENYTPLPAPITQPYYIVLGILWIDSTGIKNSTKGTYCASGIASMRSPASFGVDNSTILISSEGVISLATGYLKAAGTTPLTADWDVGVYKITANQLGSDVAVGTPPLVITSTTKVDNLNVDQVDGIHGTAMLLADGTTPLTGTWDAGSFQIRALTLYSDVAIGTPPLTVVSTTLVSNLNADQVDGLEASAFLKKDATIPLTSDWDAGSYKITALTFASDQATGTAPLTVASTTKVSNLNADQVDGVDIPAISTKGMILAASAASTLNALAVGGTNGQVLMVASGETTGLKYSDHGDIYGLGDDDHTQYALRSLLSTRGDIPYRGASVWERRGLGTYGQILKSDGVDPVWGTLSGGINYITNYDAGANVSGWDEYADTAGLLPVDGTGGTHTGVTWTRSTSTPLRGAASFLLAKDAANRQGMGVGYNFVIDPVDRTNMLTLSFNWQSDCTLLEGDLIVYIAELLDADDTLVSLIQPTPYKLPGTVASVNNNWSGQFQTPYTNTHFRLIIHIASTSTSAWNVKFDQFALGPTPMKQGVPVTDAKTWTPVFVGLNAGYTVAAFWERCGDMCHIWGHCTLTGASTATISMTVPFTADTAKLPVNYTRLGSCLAFDSNVGTAIDGQLCFPNDATKVWFIGGAPSGWWAAAVPFAAWENADEISFDLLYPVLGWSSNCQVSSDAETRVVAAHCYYSGAHVHAAPNASAVKVGFDVASNDTHNGFVVADSRYVVKIPGKYNVSSHLSFTPTNVLANRYLTWISKNGSEVRRGDDKTVDATTIFGLSCVGFDIDCIAGDYFEIFLYGAGNNSANTLEIDGLTMSYMDIHMISGPSQIAASEKVYAIYTTDGGQAIGKNWNSLTLNYEDKVLDSHGAVNVGATWIFTAPKSGMYTISTLAYINTAPTGAQTLIFRYYIGAVEKVTVLYPYAVGTISISHSSSLFMYAGETFHAELGTSENNDKLLNAASTGNKITIISQ